MRWADEAIRDAGVALLLGLIVAWGARAEPHTIEFENPGPGLTTSLEVCWMGSCVDYAVPCEAGQVCTVEADLGYGCGELVVATAVGPVKSGPDSVQYCVAGRERFDVNGDGAITVIDFAMGFLRAFQSP